MSASGPTAREAQEKQDSGRTDAALTGGWLTFLRPACLVIIALTLALWFVAIPIRYQELGTVCRTVCGDQQPNQSTIAQFRASGLTLGFYSFYIGTLEVLFALTFVVIALVILWKKSDTRIGLLTALFLTTFGVANTSATALMITFPVLFVPVNLLQLISWISLGLFLFVFPDGRFSPSWMRLPAVAIIVIFAVSNSPFFPPALFLPFFLAFVLLTLLAQIYRYRFVSTPAQRQQTKWVMLGITTAVACILGLSLLVIGFSLPQNPTSYFFLFGDTLWYLFELLIPLSIGFAIVRAKLWDIDVVINRALVYGVLTVVLGLIYFGVVIGLQLLVGSVAGTTVQSPLLIVGSTLLIAALFHPLRRRIQAMIDRRFYRRKYDTAKIVAAFSATLRQEVDLATVRDHLVEVVQETMQPSHVSLWLRPSAPDRKDQATWRSTPPAP